MKNNLERFLIAQQNYFVEISQALLEVDSNDATAVMGWPDDLKLKSSMTLFAVAKPECEVFQKVLDKFFHGERDNRTIEILSWQLDKRRLLQWLPTCKQV